MLRLKDIGEFGLIERIAKGIKLDSSVIKGIGDDCAVVKFSKDKYLLFTADMLIEDVHFRRTAAPYCIGHKALACSISDIAAMGGEPKYALVSLGLPKNLPVSFVDGIYKGIKALAGKFGINIVGGDTNRSDKIIIDVAIAGLVEKDNLVKRDGAKAGDIIIVSGSLGGSRRGRHLNFTPRLKEACFLVNNFKINAMIDISDGLVSDLGHILKQSKVGAVVYEQFIPQSPQAKSIDEALFMGEDFELLFTAGLKDARKILAQRKLRFTPLETIAQQSNDGMSLTGFTAVGEITQDKGIKFITKDCKQRAVSQEGFRHF